MYLPENTYGNIEYKWKLINLDESQLLEKKMTQLKFRLNEGNGEAIYFIGVRDNGYIEGITREEMNISMNYLNIMIKKLGLYSILLFENQIKNDLFYRKILIQDKNHFDYIDIKIGMIGNVDSGKSTLTSVITNGCKDNGRGSARILIFNHQHEKETGRTSSIGHQFVGFDDNGEIIHKKKNSQKKWIDIINNKSKKIITFFDLAGHERYLKTTIYGLSSFNLDYCIVVIGANMGINHMTREHISVCLALNIPIIIVFTKIDIAPINIMEENWKKIELMCNRRLKKIPIKFNNKEDILDYLHKDNILPIFEVSNLNLSNMNLLEYYLSLLYPRKNYDYEKRENFKLQIDEKYSITGFGTVVSGIVKSGKIKINDNVYIGPDEFGNFMTSKIKSIHIKLKNVNELSAGIYGCLCLKNIDKQYIKKGMVILDENSPRKSVLRFWAIITVHKTNSTTIKENYQPFVHIENIRQTVKLLSIQKITNKDSDFIRNGDEAKVHLEFKYKAEYIEKNMKLLFRDGLIKASGFIIDL